MNVQFDGKEYYKIITRKDGSTYKVRCSDKQSVMDFFFEIQQERGR